MKQQVSTIRREIRVGKGARQRSTGVAEILFAPARVEGISADLAGALNTQIIPKPDEPVIARGCEPHAIGMHCDAPAGVLMRQPGLDQLPATQRIP